VVAARAVRIGPKNLQTFSIPGSKPGEMEPLDKLEAAAITQGGSVLVSDEKKKKVFRFDGKYQYQGPFPDVKERQVSRMMLDGEGAIVMLDRDEKAVRAVDETGKVLRTIAARGPGYELKKPVDVTVDLFRNTYVADEEGAVLVFSPAGQLIATVGAADLKKPRALTVDPAGAVLVYDDKLQRILRFK
jgi:sugar lactone lactonase YvrE